MSIGPPESVCDPMDPTLGWLDFDAAERERAQRVLDVFEERETRDELGLGAIRDSFSDRLFPGTSTIQTRLRYLFFVPWIYLQIERQRVPSREVAERARRMELDLITPLSAQEDNAGVIGQMAKRQLKRLPSSVYWAALRLYGICLYPGTLDEYHRALDSIYRRRDRARARHEGHDYREPFQFTWHPKLPPAPDDFPEHATFRLTREEAQFYRDCLLRPEGRDSLLAHLAWHCEPADVEYPWEHPRLGSFSEPHREILEHARLFSQTMHGAAILYNLLLAEAASRQELADAYSDEFQRWAAGLGSERRRIGDWNLRRLWELVNHPRHTITVWAREFVQSWVALFLEHGERLHRCERARRLIMQRESQLKGPRSRFRNRRALEQWSGRSGLRPMSFRWENVRIFLRDLEQGLKLA